MVVRTSSSYRAPHLQYWITIDRPYARVLQERARTRVPGLLEVASFVYACYDYILCRDPVFKILNWRPDFERTTGFCLVAPRRHESPVLRTRGRDHVRRRL